MLKLNSILVLRSLIISLVLFAALIIKSVLLSLCAFALGHLVELNSLNFRLPHHTHKPFLFSFVWLQLSSPVQGLLWSKVHAQGPLGLPSVVLEYPVRGFCEQELQSGVHHRTQEARGSTCTSVERRRSHNVDPEVGEYLQGQETSSA